MTSRPASVASVFTPRRETSTRVGAALGLEKASLIGPAHLRTGIGLALSSPERSALSSKARAASASASRDWASAGLAATVPASSRQTSNRFIVTPPRHAASYPKAAIGGLRRGIVLGECNATETMQTHCSRAAHGYIAGALMGGLQIMSRILLSSVAAVAVLASAHGAAAQTEIQWWHAMPGNLGEAVNALAEGFN